MRKSALALLLLVAVAAVGPLAAADEIPADVVFENRTIVTFRAPLGPLTPEQRARSTVNRLKALPVGAVIPAIQTGRVVESAMVVTVHGNPVITILEGDVDPESGLTLTQVTDRAVAKLRDALAARHAMNSGRFLVRASLAILAATALFLLLFLFIRIASRRLRGFIPEPGDPRFEKFRIFGFSLGPYAVAALERFVSVIGIALQFLAAYLWLAFCLTRFPSIRPWGEALDGYLVSTVAQLGWGALRAIPNIGIVLAIFVLTRFAARIAGAFFDSIGQRRIEVRWQHAETANATRRLVVAVIWVFGISVAYPYIPGSESLAFKGLSVFVGLMVSFGSAGIVNQVMAGLVIVYSRALKPGDFIKVNDVEGLVTDVGVLSTKVVTPKRVEITIPNAVLVGTTMTNYSSVRGDRGVILHTSVTIGYDTPWRQVHALLLRAADQTSGVRKDPRPFVLQTALSDFYVEYQLNAYIDDPTIRPAIFSELHQHIQDAFNEFGVQIMSPHFLGQPDSKVWAPKGNWFDAPANADSERHPRGGSPYEDIRNQAAATQKA